MEEQKVLEKLRKKYIDSVQETIENGPIFHDSHLELHRDVKERVKKLKQGNSIVKLLITAYDVTPFDNHVHIEWLFEAAGWNTEYIGLLFASIDLNAFSWNQDKDLGEIQKLFYSAERYHKGRGLDIL